jgi:hypothetical protein
VSWKCPKSFARSIDTERSRRRYTRLGAVAAPLDQISSNPVEPQRLRQQQTNSDGGERARALAEVHADATVSQSSGVESLLFKVDRRE